MPKTAQTEALLPSEPPPKRATARDVDEMLARFRRAFPEPDPTFAEDVAAARAAFRDTDSDDPWER